MLEPAVRVTRILFAGGLLVWLAFSVMPAQTLGPAVFYSDLTSGPNTGGENNAGVYVTIYGQRFGASQGSSFVTIGSGKASLYKTWSNTRIVFQLGTAASSGSITVTTSAGVSNSIPFTVRPGGIYFVSNTGSDNASGLFTAPWQTLPHAVQTINTGDTIYALNGVSQTTDDGQGWDAALTFRAQWCGTSGYPRALLAYPGGVVNIGNPNGSSPTNGIRTTDFSASDGPCGGYWVFGELTFRGIGPVGINGPSSQWRLVGNDISCPTADGSGGGGACFETTIASNVQFYGNTVHDAGTANASALFQAVYFSTDSNHVDMGWNSVYNVHGCRALQIHSSPLGSGYPNSGYPQYDIAIHDNLIHDTQCDAIIVDTIDPSQGPISIYSNIIYNAGLGPNNPEQSGGWSCINIPGNTENGTPGSGTVQIYNNTMYSCGTFTSPPYGEANAAINEGGGNVNQFVNIQNNLIYQTATSLYPSGVPYVVIWNPTIPNGGGVCGNTDNCPWLQGTNNLFYGSGPPPGDPTITVSVNANPQFVNASSYNFQLQANSPARGQGVNTGLTFDFNGVPVTGGSVDIGALEYSAAAAAQSGPALAAVVNGASLLQNSISPGAIVTCFGQNLGPATGVPLSLTGGVASTTLGSTSVFFNGLAAPLLYSQAGQVNLVVPYEIGVNPSVTVTVENAGVFSNSLSLAVGAQSPGIFTLGSVGTGQGAILNQDLSVNSAANPALRGSVIAIFLTGAGQTTPPELDGEIVQSPLLLSASTTAQIGGLDATVQYSGSAPGLLAGSTQVNVQVPINAPAGDAVPVVLTVGGTPSQPGVTVALR